MAKRKRSPKEKPLVKKKRPRPLLSDLPMDILHSIISRLPIRQAVRTSILSKNWKHVWCFRTNLKFSFKSLVHKKGSGIPRSFISEHVFIQRVDAVLKQHSGIVEKMEVQFSPLHNEHAEHIDRWVQFAIASKTKQLILDFELQYPTKEPYSFPFQLFDATSGSHLQSMKLGSVSLKQPGNIKVFLNLKKLELVDVNINDEELKFMLFNCNVLEFIGISRCKMLTTLHTPRPVNHLKHLQVSHCPLLQGIELNFGLITLEYEGALMQLAPPSTLRNVSIKSSDIGSALTYMFTEWPSTLPRLETLTLRCEELKRTTLPNKPLKFLYLRHLRLELNFVSPGERTDVLDLACLLEAAPVMEKLEVHMWVDYKLKRYRKRHSELRSLPSHPHSHLKLVCVTGFYGQKDQLELALHILRNSPVLEAMKIDPKPMVAAINVFLSYEDGPCFVDGYQVAKKYLRKADHRGVVDVIKVRRRDVKNVSPYDLVDPYWLAMIAEDE
uniref:F-box domain-containing protein n=1 Tax=Arundo donax TaxID=35708 RepID=A0A0A9F0D8_ARUDO